MVNIIYNILNIYHIVMNYYYICNPILCETFECAKVGITANPYNRLKTYRTHSPFSKYQIVYGVKCSNAEMLRFETYILFRYADKKLRIETSECILCNDQNKIDDIQKYIDTEIKKWFINVYEYKNDDLVTLKKNKDKKFDKDKVTYNSVAELDENDKHDALQIFKESQMGQDVIKATEQRLLSHKVLKENNYRFQLRDYQKEVIIKLAEYFQHNDKCILNWACGLGKTLTTLHYITKHINTHKTQYILIGAPSRAILKQWIQSIKQVKLLNKYKIVCITNECINDPRVKLTTTSPHSIKSTYNANIDTIYVTTYHSSKLLIPYKFDFVILDEVHHLQSLKDESALSKYKEINKEDKVNESEQESDEVNANNEMYIAGFKAILTIDTKKTLSLTATMKDDSDDINNVIHFGQIVDRKSVHWAIENKYITDYKVLVMESQQDVVNAIIEESKIVNCNTDLFLSAFSTIYGMYHKINNMKHTFIYTNSRVHSNTVKEYIKIILNSSLISCNKDDKCTCLSCNLYFETINSYVHDVDRIINKFKLSTYGIIICVYMLGEGFDEPIIDSVCIGQNMISKIRSIQSLLRGNRLDKNNVEKVNTVILPNNKIKQKYYNHLLVLVENLRNEDVNIENRLAYMEIKKCDNKECKENVQNNIIHVLHDSITNNIKFRLLNIKRMNFATLYNEYSMYNQRFNFKCIADYLKMKDDPIYHVSYIEDPEKYFISIWHKSDKWYGFLGIDTKLYPKSKDKWITKCKELNIKSGAEYLALCEKNNMPIDYDKYYDCIDEDIPWNKRTLRKTVLT